MLDGLLDVDAAERSSLLSALAAQDVALAAELGSLLEEHRRLEQERFLEGSLSGPPVSALPAGQTIGAYTLRSEIGMGGMGSVWLADRTDGTYCGQVAVKLLRASLLGRQGEARFRREGTILARLRHPHIAQLMDAGVSPSGQPYLVLEYVRGQRIDEYCDSRQLGIEARIRLFLDVAGAVSFAHSHLIVHRDIKPSNVLVGEDAAVKLLDFGIAKLLEEETGGQATALTREGEMMLTPEYAAPEQLKGDPVTTSTDVYTLGVLLYTLLAGRHPTAPATSSPADLVRAVVEDAAMRLSLAVSGRGQSAPRLAEGALRRGLTPRRWRAALQGDLENVVAKALKKAPAERYPSAAALADDLRRHLAHQPVSARPDSLGYRAAKFVRRNRTAATLGLLAAAALAAGLFGTVSQARRATRQAGRADAEARSAVAQRDFALLELGRTEAVNELNAFLFSDAAAEGKPLTTEDLVVRAEEVVRAQQGEAASTKVELLIQVGELYQNHWSLKRASALIAEAYDLARAQPEPSTHARAACALAAATHRNGNLEGADRLLKEAFAVLPNQPQYTVQLAKCLAVASDVASHRRDFAGGIARAEEARRLVRASQMPLLLLDVDITMQLAEAYRLSGRLGDAIAANEDALAQLTRLGRGRTDRAVGVLNDWGVALYMLGRSQEAEGLLRRARAIGRTDRGDAGVPPCVLGNLSSVLDHLDRLPEAARFAARARAAALRLGDDTSFRWAITAEAVTARRLNQLDHAARLLDQVDALLRTHEEPSTVAFAFLEMERASLARAHGDTRTAMTRADRAVERAEASDPGGQSLSRVLLLRAQMHLATGHPRGAEEDARRAVALWRQNWGADTLSGWIGQAHLALALALRAQGRRLEAEAAAAEAARHLQPCLGAGHPDTRAARRLRHHLPA